MGVIIFLLVVLVLGCEYPEALTDDWNEECVSRSHWGRIEEECRIERHGEDYSLDWEEECHIHRERSPPAYCALCYYDHCNRGVRSGNKYPEGSTKHQECQALIANRRRDADNLARHQNNVQHEYGRHYFKSKLGFWPEEIKSQRNKIP